ncbi:MAG TPA: hypothetical protein VJ901_07880 [Thermoanaerobaculia bacterium]|nr:hypothetical protein [Thermoanaerobaculia bacterium]
MSRSVIVAMIALLWLPPDAAALDLQLESVLTAGRFDFTRKTADVADAPPPFNNRLSGSTEHYDVWMGPDDVAEVPLLHFFSYSLYVRSKASPAQVTRFAFQGRSIGAFDDQMADVRFHVIDGALTETDTITLPIFGFVPDVIVSSHQPEDANDVFLATEHDVPIPITNELKNMAVTITGASAASNDAALWKPIEVRNGVAPFAPFLLRSGASDASTLKIHLDPRTSHAFGTALFRGRAKFDDIINVTLTCKTLGRDQKPVTIPVRVQFVPWPPILLMITFIGAIVGWLLLLLAKAKRESWTERLRILGSGIAVALLIEVFGMAMVLGKSELKVLDFTLDPFQMPTAALVGVLAGIAGYKSRDLLLSISQMEIFRLGGGKKSDATA